MCYMIGQYYTSLMYACAQRPRFQCEGHDGSGCLHAAPGCNSATGHVSTALERMPGVFGKFAKQLNGAGACADAALMKREQMSCC